MFYITSYYMVRFHIQCPQPTVLTKTKYFRILLSPVCLLSKQEGVVVILALGRGLLLSLVAGFQSSSRILVSFHLRMRE